MERAIYTHLSERQCSHQWREMLTSLAQELTHDLTPNHLRGVFRRAGERFAREHGLAATGNVAELRSAINRIWQSMDWGWLEIDEAEDHLLLTHFCAPLRAGFGADNMRWTGGFLEGVYELWMRQMGADASLRVVQTREPDAYGTMQYRFGK